MQSKIGQITSSLRSRPVEVLNDNFEGNSTEKIGTDDDQSLWRDPARWVERR